MTKQWPASVIQSYFNLGFMDAKRYSSPEATIQRHAPELRDAYMQGWRAQLDCVGNQAG